MATIVKAGPSDTNDQLIKKFKKKVLVEDILTEIKKREFKDDYSDMFNYRSLTTVFICN